MDKAERQRAFPPTHTSKEKGVSSLAPKHPITRKELIFDREENIHPNSTVELILDASPDILFVIDEELEILAANKKAASITNIKKTDLVLKPLSEFIPKGTLRRIAVGETELTDQTMECAPGISYPVDISVQPIQWDGLDAFLIKIKDKISEIERQELEQQLKQALYDLEVVKRLAGGIAHDANNVITVIGGNICLVKEGLDLDTVVNDIKIATERAVCLIRQLQHLTKETINKPKSANIRPLIENIISRVQFWQCNINIELNMDESEYICKFDHGSISDAIQNLLNNARDAMPLGGTITISVKNVNTDTENHCICISIEDNGMGIPEELQSQIFDPFFSTKNKEGKGFGLGLANVAKVIRRHNGQILVESKTGENSRTKFNILLPK